MLRLSLAGYRRPEDVTECSRLAPELVTLVIGQLAHRGFISDRGPTDRGIAVLDATQGDGEADVTLGWMLRCQLSGQVMPLFCDGDLGPEYVPQGRLPSFVPAPLVERTDAQPVREFQLALRRWRELLQSADEGDRSDEDYDTRAFPLDPDEAEPEGEPVERPTLGGASLPADEERMAVEVIDEAPRQVAVRTLVYLPQDPHLGSQLAEGLLVRHPFGVPGGDWFLKRLESSLPRLRRPGDDLRRWAKGSRGHRERNLQAKGISLADLAPLGQQRMLDLVGDVEPLHAPLSELAALVGEAMVRAAKQPERSDELRSRMSTLLEMLLDEWIDRFGAHREAPSDWAGTRGGQVGRQDYIKEAASRLGVTTVPRAFLGVEARGLERAIEGRGDLRDRMVLVLVDAATAPTGTHPFAAALKIENTLVEDLDVIRDTRNKSLHYRRGQFRRSNDQASASDIINRSERSLRALFSAWREILQPGEESLELDL